MIFAPRYHDDPQVQAAVVAYVWASLNPFDCRPLGNYTVNEFRNLIAHTHGPAVARAIRITLQ